MIDQRAKSNGTASPFTGQMLADVEAKTGIPAALLMGILMKESQLGTDGGALNKVNNFGGIKATDEDIKAGRYIETSAGKFRTYSSPQEYLESMAALLQGDYYAGKPLEEVLGNYYAGPAAFAAHGVNATDGAGNGTVQQYIDMVLDIIYSILGVRPSQKDVPITRTSGGGGGTMFGGRQTITQLPGGATSHGGLNAVDLAGDGPVYAPAGGTITGLLNTVGPNDSKSAGGGYGNHIKVRTDDNRYEYLVAHFAPGSLQGLRVGGKVAAGQYLGQQGNTGNSSGTHTHVELLSHTAQQQNVLGWLQSIGAVSKDTPQNLGPGDGGTGGPDGGDGAEGGTGEVITFAPLRLTLDTTSGGASYLQTSTTNNPYSGLGNYAKKAIK
jgi:murein DD-endopeptidase MepM/ murein hydrolase activator NlpD